MPLEKRRTHHHRRRKRKISCSLNLVVTFEPAKAAQSKSGSTASCSRKLPTSPLQTELLTHYGIPARQSTSGASDRHWPIQAYEGREDQKSPDESSQTGSPTQTLDISDAKACQTIYSHQLVVEEHLYFSPTLREQADQVKTPPSGLCIG